MIEIISRNILFLRRIVFLSAILMFFCIHAPSVEATNLKFNGANFGGSYIYNLADYFNYNTVGSFWYNNGTYSTPITVTNTGLYNTPYAVYTSNDLDWCFVSTDGTLNGSFTSNWITPGQTQNIYAGILTNSSLNGPFGFGSMICLLTIQDVISFDSVIIMLNTTFANVSDAIDTFATQHSPYNTSDTLQTFVALPPVTYTAVINQYGTKSYIKGSNNYSLDPVNPSDPPISFGSGKVLSFKRNDNSGCDIVGYGIAALPGSDSFSPPTVQYNPNFAKATAFTPDLTYCGGPQITCTPDGQSVPVNTNTDIIFGGGNGTYVWSAPGAMVPNGSGNANVRYSTTGTKNVDVTSGSYSKTCIVNVTAVSNAIPTVTSPTATGVTSSGATLGATVTSLGVPATLTDRGICYSLSPTLASGNTCISATLAQIVPSAYTVSVSSLSANTTYYFVGYAVNSTGTGYTGATPFTTSLTPISGVCGSANGVAYVNGSSSYSPYTQCSSGSSSNTAFPTAGNTVTWTCSGQNGGSVSPTCSASQNAAVITYSLTVNKSIGGSVTSADSFIACGASCTKNYNSGTSVTLTAVPASSYWRFIGWTGDCPAGVGTCSLTVNGNKSVTAVFAPVPFQYIEF